MTITTTELPQGLSIVIPVYRSAASLHDLIAELGRWLPELSPVYEVILIDDGSPDTSWRVIDDLSSIHPWVRGIALMRNYGQHNALLCGIRAARYDVTVTMDDDLQHPPSEIRKLLDELNRGYEVVYGTPQHEQHGLWRDLASQLTKFALQSSMGVDIARSVGPFRAFRTHIRDAFATYSNSFVSIDVLLTWGTTRFSKVKVRHDARKLGKSNYTFRKLVRHALNMITGFSNLPLQFASLVGFTFTVFGFLVLVYVIGRTLIEGSAVPGFAFLASIVAIFSGVQLFALGIMGEYMARMHARLMDRPSYAVRELLSPARPAEPIALTSDQDTVANMPTVSDTEPNLSDQADDQ